MAIRLESRISIMQSNNWEVFVEKGDKSVNDFIVKYRINGKRIRTPKHIHLLIDLLLKKENDESTANQLLDCLIDILHKIEPSKTYPPQLQVFSPKSDSKFKALNSFGEYQVDFLLILFELIMIQEKTNYPKGKLNLLLFKKLREGADIFSLVSAATFR